MTNWPTNRQQESIGSAAGFSGRHSSGFLPGQGRLCRNSPPRYRVSGQRRHKHLSPAALFRIGWPGRKQQQAPSQGIEDRVLSSIISTSSVPYSSYVALPTFLHSVHPIIKEVWLVVVLGVAARARPGAQAALCCATAAGTALSLPPRLWVPQLRRLALLCLLLFTMTALGADSVPAVQQSRAPPASLTGLPRLPPTASSYRFVVFHWGIFTITRRSLALASSAASLTFLALQTASLVLTTTPSEDIALALQALMRPLGLLGVPVKQLTLSVLLALRFMALVLEEGRNLALGLAMRGVDWKALGPGSGLTVAVQLTGRMFENLMRRSGDIALALHARGFVDPASHTIYTGSDRSSNFLNDVICGLAIAALITHALLAS